MFLFLVAVGVYGQAHDPLRKQGEKTIISFQLINSTKYVSICESDIASPRGAGYIIYRFGLPGKIELAFPSNRDDSWKSFQYAYYLRGGGAANDGLDLNYLSFTNNGWKYTVYEEYRAADDSQRIGIRLFRVLDRKVFDLRGNPDTLQGSLISLRDNHDIPRGQLPY